MKVRFTKKLELKKITISNLNPNELDKIKGGYTVDQSVCSICKSQCDSRPCCI